MFSIFKNKPETAEKCQQILPADDKLAQLMEGEHHRKGSGNDRYKSQ